MQQRHSIGGVQCSRVKRFFSPDYFQSVHLHKRLFNQRRQLVKTSNGATPSRSSFHVEETSKKSVDIVERLTGSNQFQLGKNRPVIIMLHIVKLKTQLLSDRMTCFNSPIGKPSPKRQVCFTEEDYSFVIAYVIHFKFSSISKIPEHFKYFNFLIITGL